MIRRPRDGSVVGRLAFLRAEARAPPPRAHRARLIHLVSALPLGSLPGFLTLQIHREHGMFAPNLSSNSMKIIARVGTVAFCFLVGGCAIDLGNKTSPANSKATVGQELIDLKRARDGGAITEEEYQAQRRKIIDVEK